MKKIILYFLVFLMPVVASAHGDFFEVRVIDFTDKGGEEYRLHFIQLSQPYGETHKKDEEIIVHLRFKDSFPEYKHPTKIEYIEAIKLLKEQISNSDRIRFGVIGRGYAKIKGTKNEYQSNALEIDRGVVYSYK